uniref:Protein kinase domain-containing protein n=1 Tax=Pseudo-nitzschia australis TaxID=44445 RepID=A0A7S4ABX7_9STRA
MTLKANGRFRLWHTEHSRIQQRRRRKSNGSSSGAATSSHNRINNHHNNNTKLENDRRSFAQMSLGGNIGSHGHGQSHNSIISSTSKKQHGSLSAVIESASQNSSTATHSTNFNSKNRSRESEGGSGSIRSENQSRASSSIATRSSMGTRNSLRSFGTLPPRGKCLTQPAEGVSNDNLCDNTEGNLIVFENDNISVPKKQVHVLTKGKMPLGHQSADFRVQSLLGQGTFAQVFKCLHTQTGQLIALKVIKNKPAYTRQAAVEIDVIRVANETNTNTTNTNNNNNSKVGNKEGSLQQQQNKSCTTDYMIDLVCYFMYKDHLCLAFELLGLNLYEVLKKRQFRGLPLDVTQNLVRQAVLGCRALAQKSIVHCDLKPENILLVDENDEESVMSAGESKRLTSSSMEKKQQTVRSQKTAAGTVDPEKKENENDANNSEKTNGESSEYSKSTNETDNTTRKYDKEQVHEQQTESTETGTTKSSPDSPMDSTIATNETHHERIKLIDFGSACFEGQISHTYIQSRFYRSPEVILGLAYDSAIDMWSLGCVAAELFLGLPILPGVHEHDQLVRISEMIGETPDWMLDQGTKSSKYFMKYFPAPTPAPTPPTLSSSTSPENQSEAAGSTSGRSISEGPRPLPQWRIKTQHEHIASLSQSELKKKGGIAKLEKQPGNRYFKRKLLSDIILHKGQSGKQEDLHQLKSFIHFLYGILDPDPWKRWTAYQVASHPFFTGAIMGGNVDPSDIKDRNHANRLFNMYWEAPSDPTIYQRKLRSVQKTRERQQAARRGYGRSHSRSRSESPPSQDGMPTVRNAFSNNNNSAHGTYSVTGHMDEAINQAAGRTLRQGSYQGSDQEPTNMSSITTQFENDQGIRILRYGSSFSGAQAVVAGPQSFSEAGNSVVLPSSYNEVDFALALRRPGVVPMGDSVTTATTSTTSMSSGNNSRSNYNQGSIQISQGGSYGSHQVLYYGNQQRGLSSGGISSRTSRSFGEGDIAPETSTTVPTMIDSRHQQVLYSSSQDSVPSMVLKGQMEIRADPPMEIKDDGIPQRPKSATSANSTGEGLGDEHSQKEDPNLPIINPSTNATQNTEAYDTSLAYQQQLAAMQQQFQQQHFILQQQQAALAMQHEQLRAYYSAAGMSAHQFGLAGAPPTAAAAINAQQFGLAGAPTTAAAALNAQQFGLAGPPTTAAAALNAQQFGLAGPPTTAAAALNAQQFGLSGAPAVVNAQQFGIAGAPTSKAAAGMSVQQFGIAGAPTASLNGQQYAHPSTPSAPVQSPGLSAQQFGLAGAPGGGYYLVPAADGTQIIVAASNPGVAIPLSGQVPGMAPMPGMIPGQIQGLSAPGAQLQGIAPTWLPPAGGIHPVGMMPTAGSLPTLASTTGVAGAPSVLNNTSCSTAPPSGVVNNNQQ